MEFTQLAAMAANEALLNRMNEADAQTLEYLLQHGKECYATCLLFNTFPDEGRYARKHYPKHIAFLSAGKYAKERGFVAANRIGKTRALCFEDACHLTGLYPHWWKGKVFNEPVSWLVSGLSNESTRKVLTPELLGRVRQHAGRNYVDGTGLIPASHFVPGSLLFRGGSGRIVSEIDIYYRDSKTEFSTLYIMSNEQGWGAFSGTARHGVHLDEEHDLEVYSECLTRTATTEGIMMTSFTPLAGITETVMKLLPEFREQAEMEERVYDAKTGSFDEVSFDEDGEMVFEKKGEETITRPADGLGHWVTNHLYTMRVGWGDNPPHLTEAEMLAQQSGTPKYLLDAKTKGIPVLGRGRVYPIDIEMLKVAPFKIPDHWPRVFALDPGTRTTACIWGAFDMDSECWYLYREYSEGYAPPFVHAQRILGREDWIPGVVDPAGLGTSANDGMSICQHFRDAGLNLTLAENSVSDGIQTCYKLMTTDRLKIFSTLHKFESEFMLYRWNHNPTSKDEKGYGKPIKKNDHIMDCFDPQTEVLTQGGWVAFPDLEPSDILATVNLDTDALEYQEQSASITRRWHDGEMVQFTNKLDALVTPNHRMVVYPRTIAQQPDTPIIVPADELTIWQRVKLTTQPWRGIRRDLPVDVVAAHGRGAELDPHVWAEFLGWYVAEGSCETNIQIPGRGYGVHISQKTNLAPLERLLEKTPWKWGYHQNKFVTSCKWLHEYVSQLGKRAWKKRVPQWILDSEPSVIEAFLKGAVAGDGWIQNGGMRAYATTSKRLADEVQELFLKIGRSASVMHVPRHKRKSGVIRGRQIEMKHDQWWVIERKLDVAYLRDSQNKPNFHTVPYEGPVYCATVPNGTLIVRRNGKPMVAGNCMRYLVMSGLEVATTRERALTKRFQRRGGWVGSDQSRFGDSIAGY